MPDINSYVSYFETLTNKPELSSEDFKEATNMLIGMIKDINQEKLIHAKDGGKVRALGSINSIYLSIFNKIIESSGQKAPFGQAYEDMKKSAAESLHEQPQEYQELFKQLDNFRNKFIENSTNISQESKEEATKLNATYQQEEIAKTALTEIEKMA